MKKLFKYREVVGFLVSFVILFAPVLIVNAQDLNSGGGGNRDPFNAGGGGKINSIGGSQSFTLDNPLKADTVMELVTALLNAAILIGIPIAVLFIVWAGFRFVLARGNPEALKKAQSNFLWTIIGIGIFIGASVIVKVLEGTLAALRS